MCLYVCEKWGRDGDGEGGAITSRDCDRAKVGREAWRVPVIKMHKVCVRIHKCIPHIHTDKGREGGRKRDVKHFFL